MEVPAKILAAPWAKKCWPCYTVFWKEHHVPKLMKNTAYDTKAIYWCHLLTSCHWRSCDLPGGKSCA